MLQVYHVRYNTFKPRLKPSDRKNAMALLRACRQVYWETASLPYKLNTFVAEAASELTALVTQLRPYQHTQITSLEFGLHHDDPVFSLQVWGPAEIAAQFPILEKPPDLKRIEVCLLGVRAAVGSGIFLKLESDLLSPLRAYLPQVDITLTTTADTWRTKYMQQVKAT
jgi:hypothetical protein